VKNERDFEGYVIVTFDLNNLKQCNDQYGHRAGDEYIINAAHIIEDNFERYGKCYRIGGDEFCCIIPKGIHFKIERVIHKIDQDVEVLNHKNIIPVPGRMEKIPRYNKVPSIRLPQRITIQ
jgi:diguanylate cyclase (GGDEF)-like protein